MMHKDVSKLWKLKLNYKFAGEAGNENIGKLREELSNVKLEMSAQNEMIKENLIKKNAIKELEFTLTYLETELVMVKDYSKINKETISNLEEKLSIVRLQLKEAKNSYEKRTNVIKELEAKFKEATGNLLERK
ncbi:Kinesin family member 4/21/27 [Gigaspora margarita]|uniref:Kinesin family member 4/21/27 n=1 Tax=Gigaspora margarita TaxID=4874 RepID=A0A8H4A7X2_GIGMA|nr:Kinesin family member 4/21/27 [Gigaspora margarita]